MNDQSQPEAAPEVSFNDLLRLQSRMTAAERNARYGPASFMADLDPASGDIPTVPTGVPATTPGAVVDPIAAFVQPVDFGGGSRGRSPSELPQEPDFNAVIRDGARLAGSLNPRGRWRS